MMFIIFVVLVCFALLSLGCCVFAVFWGMIEDTELGRFIIMKIKNKYSGGGYINDDENLDRR